MLVQVPPADAFRIFTEEIDLWWRRGLKYRMGRKDSVLQLEPKLGGRLFETDAGKIVHETGRITLWVSNFTADEKTEVEVRFEPSPSGTLVTVQHRGFSRLRPDHPVRHGEAPSAFMRRTALWWGSLFCSLREHALRET